MVAGVSLPADIFFARYHLSSEGSTGVAYSPMVDGEVLTFEWDNGVMRDEQTGSIWNFAGRSIDGPLKGNTITPLPVRSTLWFVLIASYPDSLTYTAALAVAVMENCFMYPIPRKSFLPSNTERQ